MRDELAEGRLWTRAGLTREIDPLRAVLLAVPGEELAFDRPPDEMLMLDRVDLAAMRVEADAVASAYASRGVVVHRFRARSAPPPNFIFMRDLFFMTPEGAVLARMGVAQRAGEERFAAEALASLGIPIVSSIGGRGTFEGADALWLDSETVLVGVGRRTNREGLAQLRGLLRRMGVRAVAVEMPLGVQHLLGIVNFIDHDLAAVAREKVPPGLRRRLVARNIRLIELEADAERVRGRGMNFVTLEPGRVLMPAGCPALRARLEEAGARCDEVRIDQYLRAAGGVGCLTGILHRA